MRFNLFNALGTTLILSASFFTQAKKNVFDMQFKDDGFKECVLEQAYWNSKVYTTDFTSLRCDQYDIESLDELQQFKNLRTLAFSKNLFTTIDLSSLKALEHLTISDTPLNSIDLTYNTELTRLNIFNTHISQLDTTYNLKLQQLNIPKNQLSYLNVDHLTKLRYLGISYNEINYLSLAEHPLLKILKANDNNLKQLDTFRLPNIEELKLHNNNFQILNLSLNQKLFILNIGNNPLTPNTQQYLEQLSQLRRFYLFD